MNSAKVELGKSHSRELALNQSSGLSKSHHPSQESCRPKSTPRSQVVMSNYYIIYIIFSSFESYWNVFRFILIMFNFDFMQFPNLNWISNRFSWTPSYITFYTTFYIYILTYNGSHSKNPDINTPLVDINTPLMNNNF